MSQVTDNVVAAANIIRQFQAMCELKGGKLVSAELSHQSKDYSFRVSLETK